MLSVVDELDPNIRSNPLEPSPEVQAKLTAASEVLGIPINCFGLNVPYRTEHKRNFLLEVNTLQMLHQAVKAGAEKQQKIKKQLMSRDEDEDEAAAAAFLAQLDDSKRSAKRKRLDEPDGQSPCKRANRTGL